MKLIITEKNIAAKKIADILGGKKAKADKVYKTPVYYFTYGGEECVAVGLKGHILEVVFPQELTYAKKGWTANWEEGDPTPAEIPKALATPPWARSSRVFPKTGVVLTSWNIKALPYLIWAPVGKQPAEREIVRALKTLAKRSTSIVIATDFDREGELIGSDARGIVSAVNPTAPVTRARYSAITKDEIERAFSESNPVDDNLAESGGARQDIDLIWGAVLTRYLSKVRFSGVASPRSAGRVQTPTLKLIVDKEKERSLFVPEDYWVVSIQGVTEEGEPFSARHATNHFKNGEQAEKAFKIVEAMQAAAATGSPSADMRLEIIGVEAKRKNRKPPVPFNTTSLQVAAAAEGLSPSRTMRIAESLYMNGLVSYPRVDNTVYPVSLDLKELVKELAKVDVYRSFANNLLKAPLHATRGEKETTDHPPIHPTGAANPDDLRADEWKLYNLISRRFLATLSTTSVVEETTATLDAQGERFIARGNVVVEAGYREIYHYGQKKELQLPPLAKGGRADVTHAEIEAKQTMPPPRYTEGSIITKMEAEGLGTKATRHDAIQKLISRSYVILEDKSLAPTMLGTSVIDALSTFAEQITSPQMTANLEDEMNQIAEGLKDRTSVVNHSRALLADVMAVLVDKVTEVGELLAAAEEFDAYMGECPKCGKDLVIKTSQKNNSRFVGCKGYPDCDNTYPLPQGRVTLLGEKCESCAAPRIKIQMMRSKPMERCINPGCETNYEPNITLDECPVCAAEGRMFEDRKAKIIGQRSIRTFKRFARCENYEVCGVSYPLPGQGQIKPTEEICEGCGFSKIEVETRRGLWTFCPNLDCPIRAEEDAKKEEAKKAGAKKATAKKTPVKKPAVKKTAVKKTAVKKPAAKKPAKKDATPEVNEK